MASSSRDFDWRGLVKAVAPTIATALGGPLAGLGVRALSEALLGRPDGSESDVARALEMADGSQLVKLREIDAQFQAQMKALDVDLERIAAADRDSARQREIGSRDSWTPRVIGAMALGGFLWAVYWVLSGNVQGMNDPTTVALVGTLVGYISAKADQVVSYYFGSSAGSARKTEAMSDALEKGVRK